MSNALAARLAPVIRAEQALVQLDWPMNARASNLMNRVHVDSKGSQ